MFFKRTKFQAIGRVLYVMSAGGGLTAIDVVETIATELPGNRVPKIRRKRFANRPRINQPRRMTAVVLRNRKGRINASRDRVR